MTELSSLKVTNYSSRLKNYIKSPKSYYLKEWYIKALNAFVKRKFFFKAFFRRTKTNFYVTITTWFGRGLVSLSRNRFKSKILKKKSKNLHKPFISRFRREIRKFYRRFRLKRCFFFLYCFGTIANEMMSVIKNFVNTINYMHRRFKRKRLRRKNIYVYRININPANAHNGFRKKKKRRL